MSEELRRGRGGRAAVTSAYSEAMAYYASLRVKKRHVVSAGAMSIGGEQVTVTSLDPQLQQLALSIQATKRMVQRQRRTP